MALCLIRLRRVDDIRCAGHLWMKLRKNYEDYVDCVLGGREHQWVRSRRRASRVAAPTPDQLCTGWRASGSAGVDGRVSPHERRRFPPLSRRFVMADPVDDPQRDEDQHVKDVRDRQKRS